MKFRKALSITALVFGGLLSGAAQAVPYVGAFNTGAAYDGVLTPVSGFDVFSNGSAAFFCVSVGGCAGGSVAFGQQLDPASTNQIAAGDLIQTIYQGVVNVVNPGTPAPNLIFPGQAGTYQITVAAIFNEQVIVAAPGVGILQPLDGGNVALFYDNATLAGTFIENTGDILAGVGFTDGQLIAQGSVSQGMSLLTLVNSDGTSATGSANIGGLLGFVQAGSTVPDVVGFIPPMHDFTSTTTLQFGPNIAPDFQTVGFFDNNAFGFTRTLVNSALVERADANIDFSAAVPEPGSLALLGIALAGLGFLRRRRVV